MAPKNKNATGSTMRLYMLRPLLRSLLLLLLALAHGKAPSLQNNLKPPLINSRSAKKLRNINCVLTLVLFQAT